MKISKTNIAKYMKQHKKRTAVFSLLGILLVLLIAAIITPFFCPIQITDSSLPYEYTIHGTYIEINRYTGQEEEVIIPESIWLRPVKVLGSWYDKRWGERGAFSENKSVKKVVMPDTIESMEGTSFEQCSNLEEIKLSKSLKVISWMCFWNCTSLKEIEIPEGVRAIGDSAFLWCETLERVILPESLTKICQGAFSNCTKLDDVVIPKGVELIQGSSFENTKWAEGFDEEFVIEGKNVLLSYEGNEEIVEVPEGVEYIGEDVFREKLNMKQLVLPVSLVKGEYYMVYLCENLEYVVVRNPSMEFLYDDIFKDCNPKMTLVGEKGSTAEAYAKEQGIPFLESIPEE